MRGRMRGLLALGAALCLVGCDAPNHGPVSHTVRDLRPLFAPAAPEGAAEAGSVSERFLRSLRVVRQGREQDAWVLVAPMRARAALEGLRGEHVLEVEVAPVYNVGDGLRMTVLLYSPRKESVVFERYFDAGRLAEDRSWVALRVPLVLEGTDAEALEIRVDPGPYGDMDGDWLALTGPRLIRKSIE